MTTSADLGLVGLSTMGRNLAHNFIDHGYRVAAYEPLCADHDSAQANGLWTVHTTPQAFLAALQRPRRILMMITAGATVEQQIAALCPLLDAGDVLVDGANSNFHDTLRRYRQLSEQTYSISGYGYCRRCIRCPPWPVDHGRWRDGRLSTHPNHVE